MSDDTRRRLEAAPHELKTWPRYFEALCDGSKTFEARKNDRDFKVGDTLRLREFDMTTGYSGRELTRVVTYVLDDDIWTMPGIVVLGLSQPAALPAAPPPELEQRVDQAVAYIAGAEAGRTFAAPPLDPEAQHRLELLLKMARDWTDPVVVKDSPWRAADVIAQLIERCARAAALPAAPPLDLVALVLTLQAHAREHGWQDVDEPIAALLAYPLANEPAGPSPHPNCPRCTQDGGGA